MKRKWLAVFAALVVVIAAGMTLVGCKIISDDDDKMQTVTFDPNVPKDAIGAKKLTPQKQTYPSGSTQQFPKDIFSIDGYSLVGWATNANAISPSFTTGDSFTVDGDKHFYAVWKAVDSKPAESLPNENQPNENLPSENQPSESQVGVLTIKNNVVVKCDTVATGYVEIPDGVTEIAENAFSNCVNIKGVVIPEGVKSIGYGAFKYCSDMLSVEIPSSVTYIGDNAFEYCNNLAEVNFTGTVSQLATLGLDTKGFKDMGTVSVTVNYRKSGEGLCHFVSKGDTALKGYVIIPSVDTEITKEAFKDCSGIVGVGIPYGVTSIGLYAFNGCTNLTSISIANSVSSIKSYSFKGCTSLTDIKIPDSVTYIGSYTFDECTNLDTVTYGGTLAQWCAIDNDFTLIHCARVVKLSDVDNLKTVTKLVIPNGVTYIGRYGFSECTSLTSVEISDSVKSIESYAFRGCTSLADIVIPNSVTSIEFFAFEGCKNLTSVEIPNSVISISLAFVGCDNLTIRYSDAPPVVDGKTYNIGDKGSGGGYVFYYSAKGFIVNGKECHYLECSSEQLGNGNSIKWCPCSNSGDYCNVLTSTDIGAGYANTQAICKHASHSSATASNCAAQVCASYKTVTTEVGDWYLPSRDELYLVYLTLVKKGVISSNSYYWSSSQDDYFNNDGSCAWNVVFETGYQSFFSKFSNFVVRAVRAF